MGKKLKVFNPVCKHGLVRSESCDTINSLISDAGLPNLKTCDKCTLTQSLTDVMTKNNHLALNIAYKLGIVPNSELRPAGIRCPVINEPIVDSCALKECAFHTTYPGVKNCTLVYMNHNKLEALEVLDLSLLLGLSSKTITERINTILTKLRKTSIETTSEFGLDPQFVVIPSKVCYTCETPVVADTASKFYYCSPACEEAKPSVIAQLESNSGVNIKTLITWAKSQYLDYQSLQQALGLGDSELQGVLKDEAHLEGGLLSVLD